MLVFLWRWLSRTVAAIALALIFFLAARVYELERGPPLEPWHVHVPEELDIAAMDAAGWPAWLAAEERLLATLEAELAAEMEPRHEIAANRYFAAGPLHPGGFATDWNRSFVLVPEGPPKGVAVFLHGLTDAPYSLRHVAGLYQEKGYLALAIRLPGHGTVPGGLVAVDWPEWLAATRLAARAARAEASALGAGQLPFHLVGYSNGAALALKYAIDALDDPALARPDRLVLISPMVGVTAFARFAGIAAWPAFVPRWAKAAWISIEPEFNPFKYNSFPVNAARQSYLVTASLQAGLRRLEGAGRLGELPPILAFQSVVDATVSTSAVVSGLFARLPMGAHELVLLDVNRGTRFGSLLRGDPEARLAALLPPPPRRFSTTIVANAANGARDVVARLREAGATQEHVEPLGLAYPADVFSLSHVALPFPLSDSLYGLEPEPPDEFGVSLGAMAARGERGALVIGGDALIRMSSNPFFPYMAERIAAAIDGQPGGY